MAQLFFVDDDDDDDLHDVHDDASNEYEYEYEYGKYE